MGQPKDILSLVKEYGSVVNWLRAEKELKIDESFLTKIVEAYAFRGVKSWLLIDNKRL